MDTFNILAGIVTITSLVFSVWIYMDSKKKESIEKARYSFTLSRLSNFKRIAETIVYQANLVGSMSDRDETTKKELKHLTVSMLNTAVCIRDILSKELDSMEKWKYGVPEEYLKIESCE